MILIDDLLIGGFERVGVLNDVGQFTTGFAAEGHDHIAAALADGVDLIVVQILFHRRASVPGRLGMINGVRPVAVLVADDEGQRVILQAAGIVAVGELKIIAHADIHIRRKHFGRPRGTNLKIQNRDQQKGNEDFFHAFDCW